MRFIITLTALLVLGKYHGFCRYLGCWWRGQSVCQKLCGAPWAYRAQPGRANPGYSVESTKMLITSDCWKMVSTCWGTSSFSGYCSAVQQLVAQEKKVGADISLVYTLALTKVPDSLRLQQAKEEAALSHAEQEQTNIEQGAPDTQRLPVSQLFYEYYATYWGEVGAPGARSACAGSPDR